ncbi:MAG TPA: cyclase family protein [Thermoanaerobaculia bacterium]|jgi:arylformamidase|nr:cyclase family protein [Thermoanaerobaculia bacterium]
MTLIDISPLIDATINVWPGDTPFVRTVNTDMHTGANLTLSDVRMTLHVGAHADAPSHYITDGPDIASQCLDLYLGRCVVVHVDVARGDRILPDHVADKVEALSAPRILFHTGTFPDHNRWNNDFASLSPELVDDLYHHGVRLIGIDTPSVDLFDSKSLEAHHAFAWNNMAMLEGLMLEGVEEGEYELIALPLRIRCADASPVRAVLRTL